MLNMWVRTTMEMEEVLAVETQKMKKTLRVLLLQFMCFLPSLIRCGGRQQE